MPKVGKMDFPYTAKGVKKAKSMSKKMGMDMMMKPKKKGRAKKKFGPKDKKV